MGALGKASANTERNKRKAGGSLSVSLSLSLNITSTQLFLAGRRSLSALSFYKEGKALHMQHTKHKAHREHAREHSSPWRARGHVQGPWAWELSRGPQCGTTHNPRRTSSSRTRPYKTFFKRTPPTYMWHVGKCIADNRRRIEIRMRNQKPRRQRQGLRGSEARRLPKVLITYTMARGGPV
jgi:hypothetical protein